MRRFVNRAFGFRINVLLLIYLLSFFGSHHNDSSLSCLQMNGLSSIVGVCALKQEENTTITTAQRRSSLVRNRKESTKNPVENNTNNSTTSLNTRQVFIKAAQRGWGGGVPGAMAGIVQVLSLMWLRTVINYQIRYGVSFRQALQTLWAEGKIGRFYQGVGFALIQAPLSRFVSTFSNDGMNLLLHSLPTTSTWGAGRTTLVASFFVGLARMTLMPIDTCKTVLQINSVEGFRALLAKVKQGQVGLLYQGAIATSLSAIVAHYPWFYTYNLLSKSDWIQKLLRWPLLRNGVIGFMSSIVSDVVVNAIRVVKTTKQSLGSTAKGSLSYTETVQFILRADGYKGLFGRGLRTRILANSIQSVLFTIVWRGLAERNQKGGEEQ